MEPKILDLEKYKGGERKKIMKEIEELMDQQATTDKLEKGSYVIWGEHAILDASIEEDQIIIEIKKVL